MQISYTKVRDYYIPNLIFPSEKSMKKIGKYGRLRLKYLKENHKDIYSILHIKGEITSHLETIDNEAKITVKKLVNDMCINENVTEKLKEKDQIQWVKKMNYFKNVAEEVVLRELIYC